MAEEKKDEGKQGNSDPNAELTPDEYQKVFDEELSKGDVEPAPENPDKPNAETEKAGAEQAQGAPASEPTPTPEPAPAWTPPERVMKAVEGLGFKDKFVLTPENLPFVETFMKEVEGHYAQAHRFAAQNKQLSEKYQALKKELDEFKGKLPPGTRLKEALKDLDKGSLPESVKEYLEDENFLAAVDVLLSRSGVNGEKAPVKPNPTDTPPQTLTPEMEAYGKSFEEKVLSAHPDGNELLLSPDFKRWISARSKYDIAKVFKPTGPEDHIEVFNAYKQEKAVAEAEAKRRAEAEKKAADAKGLGAIGDGGAGNQSAPDYFSMSDEEFEKHDRKARATPFRA